MYVCLCHGLTEKELKKLITENQCRHMKSLQKHCGAGKDCGSCLLQVNQLLKKCQHEVHSSETSLIEEPQTKRA